MEQLQPSQPAIQVQVQLFTPSVHVALFSQGPEAQSSISETGTQGSWIRSCYKDFKFCTTGQNKVYVVERRPHQEFFFLVKKAVVGRDMQIVPFSFVDSPNLHYSDSCCFQTSCGSMLCFSCLQLYRILIFLSLGFLSFLFIYIYIYIYIY